MITWTMVMERQEHLGDLRREAERDRLVRQALAGQGRDDRFLGRALAWSGQLLVLGGQRLQQRYGATVETATVHVPRYNR